MEEKIELAIKEYEENNLNKAISLFKGVLNKDPKNERALYYLCKLYRELEKWSDSKKNAEKYLEYYKHSDVLKILGDVSYFEGNYSKAKKYYSKALKLNGDKDSLKEIQNEIKKVSKKIEETKNLPKVALIVEEGSDSFTDDIVKGLSKHFWIKKVVLSKTQSRFYNLLTKGFTKHFLSERTYKILLNLFSRKLKNTFKWADVVWIEWANHMALAASYINKKNKKLFVRLHRYEAFTDYPLYINWENVDKIVFVSDFMRKVLEDRGVELNKEKSQVIYNGVDIERFKFVPRNNGFNIGFVAHIIPRKNLHIAFEIIKKLVEKDERYTLHIAGDFQDLMYERYLKHLIKVMNLEKNVVIYGWIDDIAKWWEDKNYLLSTSIHESFGYNIAEAMARGIKPIIHNFDGAEELYEKEFLFNSIDEAVEKITNKSYDSEYYRNYIIKKGWILEKQVEGFKNLVDELLKI